MVPFFCHATNIGTTRKTGASTIMTRSAHKFQAPLNRRYQEVLAKNEHLAIKTMSIGHARHR